MGLGPHKSNSKCSNQELSRQRETKAQKHKYCRISPITQLMWGMSFLAPVQLFSWPLFTPSTSLVPHGEGQEGNFPDPLALVSSVREGWADREPWGAESCNLNPRYGWSVIATSPFLVPMLLVMQPKTCNCHLPLSDHYASWVVTSAAEIALSRYWFHSQFAAGSSLSTVFINLFSGWVFPILKLHS